MCRRKYTRCDSDGSIRIEDGHHRLAAEIILVRPILTTFSGEWTKFQALFPESIFALFSLSPARQSM